MKKLRTVFIVIFMLIITAIIAPVIPIGESLLYINLSSGTEIVQKDYLGRLFSFKTENKTILTTTWPNQKDKEGGSKLVLINKAVIYPFSKEYIQLKIAREYYQLKNYCMLHSSEDNTEKIGLFILYCENNDLVK